MGGVVVACARAMLPNPTCMQEAQLGVVQLNVSKLISFLFGNLAW